MYVYGLGDPRTGELRYIGIAEDVYKRYAQHLTAAHEDEEKDEWMNDLKSVGVIPTLAILESDIPDFLIYERQKYWIQYYLSQGAPLLNIPHALASMEVPAFLNMKQVSRQLGVSERTVYRLMEDGELHPFKMGKAWRFEQPDIDAYIERLKQESAAVRRGRPRGSEKGQAKKEKDPTQAA
jgi:excisionase family DNA binding protein